MKLFLLLVCTCFCIEKTASQTFMLGTDIGGSSTTPYTNYTMAYNNKGFYETVVTESFNTPSGYRKWEFNADNISNTWRAPSSGIPVSAYNKVIAPSISTASAYFRAGVNQGSGGQMLSTIINTKYYFRISGYRGSNNYINQNMVILAANFTPSSLSGASHTAGTDTIKLSTYLSSGENLFVRYSTSSNFVSSKVAQVSVPTSSTIGTFAFSNTCSGTVYYYFYTSSAALTAIDSSVTLIGENAHDLLSFNYVNNGGNNYSILANPSVSISGNSSLCASTTTNLTASGSNGSTPYIYTWSTSNSNVIFSVSSPGPTTTINAASSSGNTNINVTLTDANGCTVTNSQSETVNATPTISGISSVPLNVCGLNNTATLTATATGGTGTYTYTWSSGSPLIVTLNSTTGVSTTVTGVASGISLIRVTVTDVNMCFASNFKNENVSTNLSVSITATESSCTLNDDKVLSGTSVKFIAAGSGGSVPYSTYTWDNNLGSGSPKSTTVTVTTTYNVTVKDYNGCTSTNSKTETVITRPTATQSNQINDPCLINAGKITVTVTGGFPSYTIIGSGTTVSPSPVIGTTISVTGSGATILNSGDSKIFTGLKGNVQYSFTVTDANGCTN